MRSVHTHDLGANGREEGGGTAPPMQRRWLPLFRCFERKPSQHSKMHDDHGGIIWGMGVGVRRDPYVYVALSY